jgi:hypothetical protein
MKQFLEIFKTVWERDVKSRFEKGLINYERQLQSIVYSLLKSKLNNDYEVFIEPVIFELDKIKPDIIVTKKKKIISIVELKCKPWEYPAFRPDMKKLERFKKEIKVKQKIVLGWIPKFVDWNIQESKNYLKLSYQIDKNLLLIMAIIGKYDSDIISSEVEKFSDYVDIQHYKIFFGYITENKTIEFGMK